jgi:hypothetical protein
MAAKARKMAAREVDRLSGPSATDEERKRRKRRLIKGPKELRNVHGKRPKSNKVRHGEHTRGPCVPLHSVLPRCNTAPLFVHDGRPLPEFDLYLKEHSALFTSGGTAMGELFFLISCVAGFTAGLVIAGVSLFGG